MHDAAKTFVAWTADTFPEHFAEGKRVVDVGSFDPECFNQNLVKGTYVGIDVATGPSVTTVCEASDAPLDDGKADTVLSTEALHNDLDYANTVTKMYNLLRPGGLLVMTFARHGRWESGTSRATPEASLTNHFETRSTADIHAVFAEHGVELKELFFDYAFYENVDACDIYFVGVKRSESAGFLPPYESPDVAMTDSQRERGLLYVLCQSMDEVMEAGERFRDHWWARVVFQPTNYYGQHISYFHILPSRVNEWAHADFVGVVPAGSQIPAMENFKELLTNCKKDGVDVIATKADIEDVVAITAASSPEFKDVWTWVMSKAGYKNPDIVSPKMLHFKGGWMASPKWMKRYCEFFIDARRYLEYEAPLDMQNALWSPTNVDDPSLSEEDRLRVWGVVREPYHRLLASRMAGFFFWITRANVASF